MIQNHLEEEKENLYFVMHQFLDKVALHDDYYQGRPKVPLKDVIGALIVMSYHGWSYRRAYSDIKILYQNEILSTFPKRSTLNRHMLDEGLQEKIKELIRLSALSFAGINDCVLIDSTWFSQHQRICGSHKRKVSDRVLRLPPLSKTRKIHFICFRDSQAILAVRTSKGTTHDNKFFLDLMQDAIDSGFTIRTLIADSAYNDRKNFAWLEEHGIKNAFIDFKKNAVMRHSGVKLRKDMLNMFWNNKEEWRESYKYRMVIEGLISSLKRKGHLHYLRSKKSESQDCEMLLKVLIHNLNIIAKHYFMDSTSLGV